MQREKQQLAEKIVETNNMMMLKAIRIILKS